MAAYKSRMSRLSGKDGGAVRTYDPNNDKPIDPKYRGSKFNPFGNGGVSAGDRIKRGSSNRPAEDDSDFDPKRHGNRKARVNGFTHQYSARGRRGR